MDASLDRQVYDLFHQVADLDADERQVFLQALAETQPLVARALTGFLRQSDDLTGGFLDELEVPSLDEPPERVGQYEIEREIGRGGMGIVYLAVQDEPRRRVALKMLRAELSNPEVYRRFQREAEVLGRLEHPGIARVIQAGTWTDGLQPRPFIAMEYIDGVRLDDYAAGRSTAELLGLMAQVCDAVQHAHQKGIIHRDLKPANILVGTVDGSPFTHVLDFGVAHLLDEERGATLHTREGQLIGTPAFMSAEQVVSPEQIDTRTDVYALGMSLYVLLTGKLPFELDSLPLPQVVHVVVNEDIPKLGSLRADLRGDVETIVAKCLERDPNARYASAGELAADLRRHISDEPISARPLSLIGQLGRVARKRRGLVVGLATALAALVIGAAAATYGLVEARQALRSEQVARQELEEVVQFFADILAAPRPARKGREVTLREVMSDASEGVAENFEDRPAIASVLHGTLARTYIALGEYAQAEAHARPAVELGERTHGAMDDRVLEARTMSAELAYYSGDLNDAFLEFDAVLQARRRADPVDPNGLGQALNDYGFILQRLGRTAEAEAVLLEARGVLEAAPNGKDKILQDVLVNLANVYYNSARDQDKALELYRTVVAHNREKLGVEHPDTLLAMSNLASLLGSLGRRSEALPLAQEVLEGQRKVLGPSHSLTLITLHNVAYNLSSLGHQAEALTQARLGLEIAEEAYGPTGESTLLAVSALGKFLRDAGQLEEAEKYLVRAYAAERTTESPTDKLIRAQRELALLRVAQRRWSDAASLLEHLVAISEGEKFSDLNGRARWRILLARSLVALGRLDEARMRLREAIEIDADPEIEREADEVLAELEAEGRRRR